MVGGRGGAGATCLAVATAICGLRRGLPTVLVDADPLGGGIDLAVGPGTRADGVRTAYVAVGREAPRPEALAAGPPVPDLPVLSWAGAAVPTAGPQTLRALLRDARSRADLVVLDLPRSGPAETSAAAGECDVALLVVPAEVRAVTAARRVARAVGATCADVRVVVRAPGPGGLSAQTVADALGVALGGVLPDEPGLDAALERGHPPGGRGSDALALFGEALLTGLGIRTGTGR
jgi:secretion/DNA translocation related CpaE-like protein